MKTNRLAREKSPYLLQHQHNPVDWFPWTPEAFAKARAENKPIFLSIGYSTCHWCHVMERESFENEAIAALLNAHFIAIKVDREERPDVDRLYMTFIQATTGSGGWPLNVFLTPELKPFFGGTYFPPEDRWGRAGLPSVLSQVAQAWRETPGRLLAHGTQVVEALIESATPAPEPEEARPSREWMEVAVEALARQYDGEWGGFSNAPKFPRPSSLYLLLRYQHAAGEAPLARQARSMALHTLRAMARGGLYDHLGGGFHRYSVDRYWHVPHFEKMLYDQALLALAYLEGFQCAADPAFAETARGILDYVARDLSDPAGGFYCAEDADSPLPEAPQEKGEGAFYIWSQAEIDAALSPDDAALFRLAYGVEAEGNAPAESDPHGELRGRNTLILRHEPDELARLTGHPAEAVRESLAASRARLFALRSGRPRPHLDDKIITAWNGLMISAYARAAHLLPQPAQGPSDLDRARHAARFLHTHLWRDGVLYRLYRQGTGALPGLADDYAFLIAGLLDLYEAGGGIEWLQWAVELQTTMDTRFWDAEHGGYFSTTGQDPSLFLRAKEDYDGAEPSPNSVAALNTLRLGAMLAHTPWQQQGEATLRAFSRQLRQQPGAMPQMFTALDFWLSPPHQVVLCGPNPGPYLGILATRFRPNEVRLFADQGEGSRWLGERLDFIRALPDPRGKTVAYRCEAFTCRQPEETPEAFRAALAL